MATLKNRPSFCTVVLPDEYDFVGQFDRSIKEANAFHSKMTVDDACPPPYFPLDVGKVTGLIIEVLSVKERLNMAIEILRDVNEWLKRNNLEYTAHQRMIAEFIEKEPK